jgi:hypothetical protein
MKKNEDTNFTATSNELNLPGKLFSPQDTGRKKHPCPDCLACAWCGDNRCEMCKELGDSFSKGCQKKSPDDPKS